MIKYLLIFFGLAIFSGLIFGALHLYKVKQKNKNEMAEFENKKLSLTKNLGKVLVIYYSYSGKTRDIAEKIKRITDGDIYEIKTVEPMPSGAMLHIAVKNQLKDKKYPELVKDFPDINKYDVVFVGAPVWWYTVATPALSFLDSYDFNHKNVVPFSTEGSNEGTFFEDFSKMAKNAVILPKKSFNNMAKKYDDAVNNKIIDWINNI